LDLRVFGWNSRVEFWGEFGGGVLNLGGVWGDSGDSSFVVFEFFVWWVFEFVILPMSLMAAPRTVYAHNAAAESAMSRMESSSSASPSSVMHYFNPFLLGSFPLRALRRLAMAFNSLSAMAPASFHLNAIRLATLKKEDEEGDESSSVEDESSVSSASQPRLPLLWFPRFGRSVKEINEVQKRRELAMERILDDNADETERKVVPFVNARGQTIFTQSWTPANPDVHLKYAILSSQTLSLSFLLAGY
jgi:hypothetical protein